MSYDSVYQLCLSVIQKNKLKYPLDVKELLRSFGLRTRPYSLFDSVYNFYFTESSDRGLITYDAHIDRYIVIYNDKMPEGTIKFTLLHELYHFLSGDLIDDQNNDRLANCFARNMLAPAPLCKKLRIGDSIGLQRYFGITDKAAEMRINLMKTDLYHIKSESEWLDNISYEPYLENYKDINNSRQSNDIRF